MIDTCFAPCIFNNAVSDWALNPETHKSSRTSTLEPQRELFSASSKREVEIPLCFLLL